MFIRQKKWMFLTFESRLMYGFDSLYVLFMAKVNVERKPSYLFIHIFY